MGMIDRLSAAVTTTTGSFGPDDHRTLAARLALGLGLRDRNRDEEAYTELVGLAGDCARVFGPEHPETLIALREAALSCLHLHMLPVDPDPARLPEAIRRLEEVAAIRERLYGATHPETLGVWLNLSSAYGTAERIADSRLLSERILAGWKQLVVDRERELGPDASETQTARMGLASQLGGEESRALKQQVAESRRRLVAELTTTLGPVHPDTIEQRVRHTYTVFNRDEEAGLLEGIAADLLNAFGPEDPRTLHAQVDLAFHWFQGSYDLAAAIDLAERIIDEIRRVLGPEHEDLQRVRVVLAGAYLASGRAEEASAVIARYPMTDDEDQPSY